MKRSASNTPTRCFRCGKEGHMSYDCLEKFNPQNNDRRSTRSSAKVNNMAAETVQEGPEIMMTVSCTLVIETKSLKTNRLRRALIKKELGVSWDVELYGELLKIGGGKERMTAYFNQTGWPAKAPKTDEQRKEFIASLHKRKTELFMALIEKKLLPLRPGVQRLIDEALGKAVKVAVCSTSNEKAVSAIVSYLLGPDRAERITIFAGDVVPRKKPDPAIYILAATTLGVDPQSCVVVEDSTIGLAAAKAAGMKCIVTKSGYTAEEDFETADAVFDCIGDPPEVRFDLDFCANLLQKQYVS
ncbi:hypothetical protein SORBI_3005G123200 [Sorghum bicolor]|uniref:CCHC-type domain-containing protein n=1 Tax=Sorghum bicolor TaxID=4558 RepID=A0A1Z5RJE4_SORBI|nr:hypothetical protein SORBI_3005G123200 [Sorghum bicolor]